MRAALLLLLGLAALAGAAPVPPTGREAAHLVERLGSTEFAEREAAAKQLDELGVPALDDLRAACQSGDPEVADRAKELVGKIERRAASAAALAPTVVELDATDAPLDAVLAALSEQAGCEVVLGGLKPDALAGKKIRVATGRVPFWAAVLTVCDAADLQIAGAGGFLAPGAMPYLSKPGTGVTARVSLKPHLTVVLEARDTKKRPASVHGAVLVEAFEVPRSAAPGSAALLHLWPEPKLAWDSVASLKVTKATGADGRTLVPDQALPPPAPPLRLKPIAQPFLIGPPAFAPNARQALVKFKPGEEQPKLARELAGSVYALVWSAPEPLATVTLDPKKTVEATGRAGTKLSAAVRTDANGKPVAAVTLSYPSDSVSPAHAGHNLPGTMPDADGNRTCLGARVTDSGGAAFRLERIEATREGETDGNGRRLVATMTLKLTAATDTAPATVTFWGTTLRQVEIPFALNDVPLGSEPK